MTDDVTSNDAPIQGAFKIDEAQIRGHVDKVVRESVEQTLTPCQGKSTLLIMAGFMACRLSVGSIGGSTFRHEVGLHSFIWTLLIRDTRLRIVLLVSARVRHQRPTLTLVCLWAN